MTERPRGASAGGAAARSEPVAVAGRVITGLLGRLSSGSRHPVAPPAPAGIVTVADLVSARGLGPARPAIPGPVEPATPEAEVDPPAEGAEPTDQAATTEDVDDPETASSEPVDVEPAGEALPVEPEAAAVESDGADDAAEAEPPAVVVAPVGRSASGVGSALRKPWPWTTADPEPTGPAQRAVPPPEPADAQPATAPPARRAGDPPDNPTDPPATELVAPPWSRTVSGPASVPEPAPEPAAAAVADPAAATDRLTVDRHKSPSPPPPVAPKPRAAPVRPAPAPRPAPARPPNRFSVAPRPTVVDDLSITGITRRSRGRHGARLFKLFFVFVFAVIVLQLIDSLLYPLYR